MASACTDSGLAPPLDDSTPVYWELRTNYSAVQLSRVAPFDTVQLVATPYDATGRPLSAEFIASEGLTVMWTSADSSKVRVSSTGFVTARNAIELLSLDVRVTLGRVTKAAVIDVQVTNDTNPPVLDEFTIQLRDSVKRAALNLLPYSFPILAVDTAGQPMTGFPIRWKSSNPKVARFRNPQTGVFEVLIPGQEVVLSANTWVYGQARQDSFTLTTGWPVAFAFPTTQARQRQMSNGKIQFVRVETMVDIGPGGLAQFQNNTGFGPTNARGISPLPGVPVDIIFDDPSVARLRGGLPGGNIIGLQSDTTLSVSQRQQQRWFVEPGTHFFTIQPMGFRGSITVHER